MPHPPETMRKMGTCSPFPINTGLMGLLAPVFFGFFRSKGLTLPFSILYNLPVAANTATLSDKQALSSAQSKLRETAGRRTTGLTVALDRMGARSDAVNASRVARRFFDGALRARRTLLAAFFSFWVLTLSQFPLIGRFAGLLTKPAINVGLGLDDRMGARSSTPSSRGRRMAIRRPYIFLAASAPPRIPSLAEVAR
jgi:hypothetical protein